MIDLSSETFDLVSAKILQSSYGASGLQTFQIELWSDNNGVPGIKLKSGSETSFTVPASGVFEEVTIDVNINIEGSESGIAYWLKFATNAVIGTQQCEVAYTGNGNGIMDITGSRHDNNPSTKYGMLYDVLVSTGSDCERAAVEAIVDCVVDVPSAYEDGIVEGIEVNPNPFNNYITIVGGNFNVEVYSSNGVIVHSAKVEDGEILDLADLSKGIYQIVLIGDNSTYVRKIVKN